MMFSCMTARRVRSQSYHPCWRRDGSAVITENAIVVMGSVNEKDEYLKSVECFTMGSSTWEYLPPMNNTRCSAVA